MIGSAGNSSQMWWDITRNFEQVFYLDASMSLSTLFASGIAWSLPEAKIWAFMGDGAFAMNPAMLMVERDLNLPNLTHILVSNRVYGATSNAPVPNRVDNDYAAMARAHNPFGDGKSAARRGSAAPLAKPDLAAEQARFKALLRPALDEYAGDA